MNSPGADGKPPRSHPLTIEGYEEFQFHAIRQLDPLLQLIKPKTSDKIGDKDVKVPDRKMWCVYENTTGKALQWGKTKDEAVRHSRFWLEGLGGPAWLLARLEEYEPNRRAWEEAMSVQEGDWEL